MQNHGPRKGPRQRRTKPHQGPFAAFVKERRVTMGLTQADLASLSGLSLDFVKDIESGTINLRLSKVLELVELMGGEIIVREKIQ
jgi:HTH-type transcriptional regulator/antitoxin HipB